MEELGGATVTSRMIYRWWNTPVADLGKSIEVCNRPAFHSDFELYRVVQKIVLNFGAEL